MAHYFSSEINRHLQKLHRQKEESQGTIFQAFYSGYWSSEEKELQRQEVQLLWWYPVSRFLWVPSPSNKSAIIAPSYHGNCMEIALAGKWNTLRLPRQYLVQPRFGIGTTGEQDGRQQPAAEMPSFSQPALYKCVCVCHIEVKVHSCQLWNKNYIFYAPLAKSAPLPRGQHPQTLGRGLRIELAKCTSLDPSQFAYARKSARKSAGGKIRTEYAKAKIIATKKNSSRPSLFWSDVWIWTPKSDKKLSQLLPVKRLWKV